VSLEIANLPAATVEAPAAVDRSSISVLGIRRRYWEMTHGWTVPAMPQGGPEIDSPGRVA
jgi:hypothetical protein